MKPPKKRKKLLLLFEFIGVFAVLFVLIFAAANYSALSANISYWWNSKFSGDSDKYFQDSIEGLGLTTDLIPPDDRFVVPKLGINVPLIFPKNTDINSLLGDLERGVIHYPNTAEPGQAGNTFIAGHSSQNPWEKGNYKTVFTLIGKLETGDDAIIYSAGQKYVYKITGQRVVSADDLSVLEPTLDPTLTLMTCWPVGTTARRMIITGDLDIDQSSAAEATDSDEPLQDLPSSLPAFR